MIVYRGKSKETYYSIHRDFRWAFLPDIKLFGERVQTASGSTRMTFSALYRRHHRSDERTARAVCVMSDFIRHP